MPDAYPIYTPSRPRSQRSHRPKAVRIDSGRSLTAACWVVAIPCGLALFVLLTMWPRSYFRSDDLVVVPGDPARGRRISGATPISLYGALTFADPDRPQLQRGDHLRWAPVMLTSAQRAGAAARRRTLSPAVDRDGRITIPYWTLVVGLGACLAMALGPLLATAETRLPRFRIGDLIGLTTLIALAAAITPTAVGQLGEGGGVLVGELTFLVVSAYGLLLTAQQSRGGARVLCSCIAGLFLLQTLLLALFGWQCWAQHGGAA